MKKLIFLILIIIGFHGVAIAQDLYDINTICTVEITFQESNWDYLLDQLYANGLEERLIGSVTVNGQVFDSVGIRYKGNSTYDPDQTKNPFNIKLDYIIDDQEYGDYGTLKLANVFKDPSFVREVLSYEIAREYFPSSESNFANVYVNGSLMGLYTNIQSVDKYFMRSSFGSDENTMAKGEINGVPPGQMGGAWNYYGTDSANYYDFYDMKSDYGWDELIGFLDTLSNHNEYADCVLNIDRHLWFLAFSNLFVNLDGPINNPQNYYIYKDDNGRMNPILWDLNMSFGVFTMLEGSGSLSITQRQELDPYLNLTSSDHPIISKILSNDTYSKMYIAHMKTMLEENFSNGWYETRALEIQDIIVSDVQADPHKFYTYSDFANNVYNHVGVGPQSVPGIVQIMDVRINYLQNLSEFQYTSPSISNVLSSSAQVSSGTEITFTADVTNTNEVYLAYRTQEYGIFEKRLMYDDGNHGDGSAGDGVYGVFLTVGLTDMQYYIYAENNNAAAFSPVRAEYEFYEISISGDLVINEFMSDNENTVADQDGEYDDWIELYNNGTENVNLDGYYLSDDVGDPYQWMFPDTSIMAGEYIVIWADDDDGQQGLHTNFKLSKSGETILLSDNSQNLLDQVTFLQQKPDTTTGRFPNGTGDFVMMLSTFGAENTNIWVGIVDYPYGENSNFILEQNYPNPFNSSTNITFKLEEDEDVTLSIYNHHGAVIETLVSGFVQSGEHRYQWESAGHSKGLYFYSLTASGKVQVKKMIVQ